ncbi:MAG TPA: 3'-5' exonuclease, partial [Burkholderiales bacterium]|nr:3'-5' exonuclease [Burkholderiales bacterium]
LFPHEQSLLEKSSLEEERRLMYVALTRARRRLYLSFAQTRMLHGQTRYNLPSRFVDEIPQGLLRWLTPRFAEKKRPVSHFTAGAFSKAPKRDPRFGGAPAGTGGAPIGFRVGQNVVHAKFGSGVIVDAEGQGGDARVQVNFGREGVKWLAVAVAKLQAA